MYRISTGPFRKKDISKILVLRAKERRHNKETKIFGTVSLIGGLKKTTKKSQFKFWNFENPWGEVSILLKCLIYELLSDPILKKKKKNTWFAHFECVKMSVQGAFKKIIKYQSRYYGIRNWNQFLKIKFSSWFFE